MEPQNQNTTGPREMTSVLKFVLHGRSIIDQSTKFSIELESEADGSVVVKMGNTGVIVRAKDLINVLRHIELAEEKAR